MEIVAVDFGATYTRFAAAKKNGIITHRIIHTTPMNPREIRRIFKQSFNHLHRLGVSKRAPVGVASIGPLDIRRGVVRNTPNLGRLKVSLKDIIEECHGAKPAILNDATAAALGETVFGRWRGVKNLVYITVSTGIGGGAVVDGHLLVGKEGNAVEIGHIVVDYRSRVRCGCGGRGHWEALCSGTGLPKLARAITGKTRWKTAAEVFDAASRGDRLALTAVREMEYLNAAAYASVINTFDPEVVVVGGGVALNHPRETLERPLKHLREYRLLRSVFVLTEFGADAPLMGAVAAALKFPES